jgi:hypothetical protein
VLLFVQVLVRVLDELRVVGDVDLALLVSVLLVLTLLAIDVLLSFMIPLV